MNKILFILVAFSAGALIGGAFLHLIPEAIREAGATSATILNLFLYLLLGFCIFFILEQFIEWHHCHRTKHKIKTISYLILISDCVHNFIDGLVIAASFIVSFPTGVVTTLAIALHEIPQEIGDFGVLVYGGFSRSKALIWNYISALTVILGGVVGYLLSAWIGGSIVFLLPFAAGNFIYIASSDLIPEIKYKGRLEESLTHFLMFFVGMILMLSIKLLAE